MRGDRQRQYALLRRVRLPYGRTAVRRTYRDQTQQVGVEGVVEGAGLGVEANGDLLGGAKVDDSIAGLRAPPAGHTGRPHTGGHMRRGMGVMMGVTGNGTSAAQTGGPGRARAARRREEGPEWGELNGGGAEG